MSFLARIRKLRGLDREIDEELRFHLEEKERRLIADGLTPVDARREARESFGSQAAVREYTRDTWILRWADDLWRDLRFAARGLRHSPGFTTVAVLTLALGIGSCTTIFTFVNALLLRDLPVQDPEELVWFGVQDEDRHRMGSRSYRFYEMLRNDGESFGAVAAIGSRFAGLAIGDSTDLVRVDLVTEDYFSLFGVRPALGRLLDVGDQAKGTRTVVLRFDFWQDRYGGDPTLVGRTIRINNQPYVVVGVAGREFFGSDTVQRTDIWAPVSAGPAMGVPNAAAPDWGWLAIIGRMAPGISAPQAQADAAVIYRRFAEYEILAADEARKEQLRQLYSRERIRLQPASAAGADGRLSYVERLTPLAVAVVLILLLCCANVANLMLGRGSQRRHEFVVRLATGGSRFRLIRQLLIEGLVLVAIGGLLGVGITWASWRHLQAAVVLTNTLDAAPDPAVAGFVAAVSILSVLLFAALPAVRASEVPLFSMLRGSATALDRGGSTLGSRGWLIAAQFALSLPLLVGAGLLIQTVSNLLDQDFGFESEQRMVAMVAPSFSGYDDDQASRLFASLLESLEQQDGFSSVGLSIFGTMSRSRSELVQLLTTTAGETQEINAAATLISEGYLKTLGIPLLAGRDVLPTDDAAAPKVLLVNESFARNWLDGESPIGRRVGEAEIVGLVADTKYGDVRKQPEAQIFQPYRQWTFGLPALYVYVRTPMSVRDFAEVIREQTRRLDSTLVITQVRTLDAQIEENMQEEQTVATLLSIFGFVALVITAIGLYGVIAFDVTRRTQEVGLRIALGAQKTDIQSMVFRRTAPWVLGGCVVGLAGAAAMTRVLEAKLFGVAALDPLTFALAAAFLLLCAAAANYLPARRAAAVEPMTALRHD
jgi:predicted permease